MDSATANSTIVTLSNDDKLELFGISFTPENISSWFMVHWEIPVYSVILYIMCAFGLQKYMENRRPFGLRGPLITWNFFLAAFSIVFAGRAIIELRKALTRDGFYRVTCYNDYIKASSYNLFCLWLFLWSKFVEFGDTLFIVLRKKQLIFLHWYHHVTVVLMSWYIVAEISSLSQWYGPINASAHSLMYTYYGLQSMKAHVPRAISMFITSYQIAQMFFNSFVAVYALNMRFSGIRCDVSYMALVIASFILISYIFLFVSFFYFAYMHPASYKKAVTKKSQ